MFYDREQLLRRDLWEYGLNPKSKALESTEKTADESYYCGEKADEIMKAADVDKPAIMENIVWGNDGE
jgi:hypothetical protein